MNPFEVHVNFASTQRSSHFNKHKKINFNAYIYIHFNQNCKKKIM